MPCGKKGYKKGYKKKKGKKKGKTVTFYTGTGKNRKKVTFKAKR